MFKKKGRYDGPVCYVPVQNGFGLEGGWHYSTKIVAEKVRRRDPITGKRYTIRIDHELPDRPLHLNDHAEPGDPDAFFQEKTGQWHHSLAENTHYEHAEKHHLSWVEKHGEGNIVQLGGEG